jgi:hypothetical protein
MAAGTGGGVELTRGMLALEGAEWASRDGEDPLASALSASTSRISWTLGSDGSARGPAGTSGAAVFGGSSDILPGERNAEPGPMKRFGG